MRSRSVPRVLMVVHSAKPAGAQLVALAQAEALASDHEFVIAVGHGALRPRFAQLGPLIRAPTRAPIWGASRPRWALDLARAIPDAIRLAFVARRHRVAAIVANSTVLVAPVLAGRLARVPVLVCAHEAPTSTAAKRLFRFHGALADTVIAISPWIAGAFAQGRSRIVMCPAGISIPEWEDRPVRAAGGPLRLLVAGTIDSHKRQDVAIAALGELHRAGVLATLEIVGREVDHAYAAELRAAVEGLGLSESVVFAGESSDVTGRMRGVDVVLVPAGEVTPLVLMEAMAVGTPVVAARMGSIPDVVVDGESGLLVEPGDAAGMAAAVRRLCDEPGLAAHLAQSARERVETHFDVTRSYETLRDELGRLAAA
jgi:glycosyltransferase involved in cell wall biosynthesis